MPKYWVKNYFAHGRFPEVGQKQKTEKEREKERERERKLVKTMDKLRMAHASLHGARKPPGPKYIWSISFNTQFQFSAVLAANVLLPCLSHTRCVKRHQSAATVTNFKLARYFYVHFMTLQARLLTLFMYSDIQGGPFD